MQGAWRNAQTFFALGTKFSRHRAISVNQNGRKKLSKS
jgi:hypothetical protein